MILTGYKLKNGIIIVNKSLLEEIKTIFDLKEQGYSNKEIIKNCNNFKILKDLQKILHMLKLLKDDKLKIYEVKEGKIRKGLETFESVQIRKEFLEEIEENKYMELERYLAFQKNIVREKYKMINLINYEEKTEKIKSFIKNLKEPLYENINENLFENLLNRINIYKKSIEFEFINEEKYKMKL